MLGGLAAGLGLAWLASSLGLGEAFGNLLMFGLLALGVMMLIGMFMRSRKPAAQAASPFAFQGAGPAPVQNLKQYRAENVGNDASARPWERSKHGLRGAAASGARWLNDRLGVDGFANLGRTGWI